MGRCPNKSDPSKPPPAPVNKESSFMLLHYISRHIRSRSTLAPCSTHAAAPPASAGGRGDDIPVHCQLSRPSRSRRGQGLGGLVSGFFKLRVDIIFRWRLKDVSCCKVVDCVFRDIQYLPYSLKSAFQYHIGESFQGLPAGRSEHLFGNAYLCLFFLRR